MLARLLPDWGGVNLDDGIVVIEFPLDPAHPEYTAQYKPYKIRLSEWIAGISQIQSDWNQTNNTQSDYIKNKPTILADAASDNKTYGRKNGAWVEVVSGSDP